MKRSLNKLEIDENKNSKLIDFQKPTNIENKEIKKTNDEELKELNEILENIFEDENIDVIIKINTENKEIYVIEHNNVDEKTRKYKYIKDNLYFLIDSIYDDLIYKEIQTFSLYLDERNLFVDKNKWRTQLINEIEYINILNEEDELVKFLENSLKIK